MMQLETSYQNLDGIVNIIRKAINDKWDKLDKVAENGVEFGAKTAQSYTASRPGAKSGKAGRIESGDMIDAIRHKSISKTDTEIHKQYGFVDEFEEYFKYQTVTGFVHNRSGRYIGPTFALRDSINPTRERMIQEGRSVT